MSRAKTRLSAGLLGAGLTASLFAGAPAHAIGGGSPVADGVHGFVAKIEIGDDATGSACTGALIDPRWVITAQSCFPLTGPRDGESATRPARPTTATIGRAGLAAAAGQVVRVVGLVRHPDRDLVLARLARPVHDIAPVKVGTTTPAVGDVLVAAGYGRTATEWVPDRPHTAPFSVQSVAATTLDIAGLAPGTGICRGDAGGPALRVAGASIELVGLHSRSWQGGCLGETETRRGATETRLDDIAGWIRQNTPARCDNPGSSMPDPQDASVIQVGDVTGDCKADLLSHGSDGRLYAWPSSGDLSDDNRLIPRTGQLVGGGWESGNVQRIVTGDVTGDGRTDIGAQYHDGKLRIWASTGNLAGPGLLFGTNADVATGWRPGTVERIVTGDFTGDGRTDLLTQQPNAQLYAWPSSGDLSDNGRLLPATGVLVGNGWHPGNVQRIVTGDFTGDGKTDIGAHYHDGKLRIWASTGNLAGPGLLFGTNADVATGWQSGTVERIITGDFTGDGRTDLLTQHPNGELYAWPSSGDLSDHGKLLPATGVLVGSGWYPRYVQRIVTGDFTGDGKADIGAQYHDGKLRIWASTGNLTAPGQLFATNAQVGTQWGPQTVERIR